MSPQSVPETGPQTGPQTSYSQNQTETVGRKFSKLEWAVIISLIIMGLVNLYALAYFIRPAVATVSSTVGATCGASLA